MNPHDLRQYDRILRMCSTWGFELTTSRHDSQSFALVPAGKTGAEENSGLPTFARGTEMYCGDSNDICQFLAGWEKAMLYARTLGFSDARRTKAEQQERNRQLAAIIESDSTS